jgi:hypothetical protein
VNIKKLVNTATNIFMKMSLLRLCCPVTSAEPGVLFSSRATGVLSATCKRSVVGIHRIWAVHNEGSFVLPENPAKAPVNRCVITWAEDKPGSEILTFKLSFHKLMFT